MYLEKGKADEQNCAFVIKTTMWNIEVWFQDFNSLQL